MVPSKPRFPSIQRLRPSSETGLILEIGLIILIAFFYGGKILLNFDKTSLQQTGEHNEISTQPLLTEIGLWRYNQIPLWNPYTMTGFPYAAGDLLGFFWNPISTLSVALWGGINGMKVSAFLTFMLAGIGQWLFGYVIGLRRMFRLWSAVLFMISGGVALLWRVGWFGLLLGIAWFPWCFAVLIRTLQRHTFPWIVATSGSIFMVISSGGGYYPVYLFVCLATLTLIFYFRTASVERLRILRTATLVVGISVALSAVIILPYIDSARYTTRDVPVDTVQYFSQPIQYGLMNYVIHTPDWFRADVLGTASGWNWFYIGWLPVAALALVPLAYSRSRRLRWPMLLSGILFLILIMWFANRYSPFKQIYDWLPFLYNYRFPNRLLIVAASPLLILAGQALEYLYRANKAGVRNFKVLYTPTGKKSTLLPARRLVSVYWIIILVVTTKSVFDTNKEFAFVDQYLNTDSISVLKWLKRVDSSLYYVDLGGAAIYWDWTPAAYNLEMPVINFQLNQHVKSQNDQLSPLSPFFATAKYHIYNHEYPVLENSTLIGQLGDIHIYYDKGALPYAFSVQPASLQVGKTLTAAQVSGMNVQLVGPNQVVVTGSPKQEGDVLVVLMSDYPGWKLAIDGDLAQLTPVNGYLGSVLLPGEHTYTFYFQPTYYLIGATISIGTVAFILVYFAYRAIIKFNIDIPFKKRHENDSVS